MEPYVHYIPLQEDLSDLEEVMEWVRDHPKEVKTIAKQGEQFYWEHCHLTERRNIGTSCSGDFR